MALRAIDRIPRRLRQRPSTRKNASKRSEKRRDQIVRAAVRLFSEKGYHPTSMEDIANAANVSKGLIYLYFNDKNDVLFYALRFVLNLYDSYLTPALNENPLAMLRMALRGLCRLVNDHIPEHMLAYRSSKDLTPQQRLEIKTSELRIGRIFRACLEACIHKGIMIPVNIDIMMYQYIMVGHTWALKHWAFRDKYTLDEYLEASEQLLIATFLTPKGRRLFESLHAEAR